MKVVSLVNKKEDGNRLDKAIKNLSNIPQTDQKIAKEVISNLEDYLQEINSPKREKLRILCAGIYNSGKSSLLNILTGSENFKIGDVPTTASIDEMECEDCIYVDTPGLNAKECDNEVALQAFKEADLILFVSNMQNGGLNAKEAEYLDGLNLILGGAENLQKQIIFLMSNLDQISADGVDKIKVEHQKNIESVIGYAPEIICCYDAITYQIGMESKEEKLIQTSKIEEVRQMIAQRMSYVKENQEQIWSDRLQDKEEKLGQKIYTLIKPIKEEIEKLEKQVKTTGIDKTALGTAIQDCEKIFKEMLAKISFPDSAPYIPFNLTQYLNKSFIDDRTSRSTLLREVKEKLERVYSKRERVIKDAANEGAERIGIYTIYEKREGNFYYNFNKKATECVLKCNDIMMKIGVNLPLNAIEEICIIPQVANRSEREIAASLQEDVIEYDSPYRLSDYMDYVDIDEYERYEGEGFFGSKTKTLYSCHNLYSAVYEMEKDLSYFQNNMKREWNDVKNSVEDFCNQLKKELQQRQNLILSSARKEADRDEGGIRKTLAELQDAVTMVSQYMEGVE